MSPVKGEESVSNQSKTLCISLQEIKLKSITPTIFPKEDIRKVLENCQFRNKAFINREVTQFLVPPIMSLYFGGADYLEHVLDEVNTNWNGRCTSTGTQICPDLAIGFGSSAFTLVEIDKLNYYAATNNWTRFTEIMYFPFLMCEVRCGDQNLDTAENQNMHSSSVAIRALLRIEQEADKYRLEKRMARLNGRILVFSISHNHREARLYGHYALIHDEQWTYHRYCVNIFFILTNRDDILVMHNFVQNLFRMYQPELAQQLKDALAALPMPGQVSSPTGGMTLAINNSQKRSPGRDANGFAIPGVPVSTLRSGDSAAKQQIDRLTQQLEQQRQQQREREAEMDERQKEEMEQHKERMEQQQQQMEQQRQVSERLHKQLSELITRLKNQKTTTR